MNCSKKDHAVNLVVNFVIIKVLCFQLLPLLPRNQTINSDVYCRELMKHEETIQEKRPELTNRNGILFH
ncbi:hypothetical protein HZH66_014284 [Vespula vulgaris]|uniref:Uncharacterized protein n=1 Tax=Vespula vulgaris TaxID=7454 RepID=A0A834J2H3_VESVU|nr:hypothetical protein HZH66_014284 [Vespula vulgaris]